MISLRTCTIRFRVQLGLRSQRNSFTVNARREVLEKAKQKHPYNNVPPSIIDKLDRQLHMQPNHPLNIIKTRIERFCDDFATQRSQSLFARIDQESPIVDTVSCFDDLRVGPDHVSRRPSDTYYVTDSTLLRTHTSAHQTRFIANLPRSDCGDAAPSTITSLPPASPIAFLCTGDVYRRDEIDASHYPVFHQMEGVRVFSSKDYANALTRSLQAHAGVQDPVGVAGAWDSSVVTAVAQDLDVNHSDMVEIAKLLPLDRGTDNTAVAERVSSLLTVPTKKLLIQRDLKDLLFGLCGALFGASEEAGTVRWRSDYFPFTEPSFEVDVLFQTNSSSAEAGEEDDGKWLEVLGSGVIHDEVMSVCAERRKEFANKLAASGNPVAIADDEAVEQHGWAFGLGLERLAMILFGIPDIRLFWSRDERFLSQFANGGLVTNAVSKGAGKSDSVTSPEAVVKFQPFSKFPLCYKDVSFWLPSENGDAASSGAVTPFHQNEVFDVIRSTAGDLVEKVRLIDRFTHPKSGRASQAFRIEYRSMERSLTNEEVDEVQAQVRKNLVDKLGITLR